MLDAFVEFAGEGFDVRGGDLTQGAAEEFLFEGSVPAFQRCKVGIGRGGEFISESLLIFEGGGLQLRLTLATPGNEGGFGDVEPTSDGGKAQAVQTEAD